MGKKLFVIIVAVLAVGIAAYVHWSKPAESPISAEKKPLKQVSLRLQWLHQAQFAGFYAAKDKGYYLDEGLDVTINPGGQDFNAVTLVAGGSDQFGIATGDQVLLAAGRGVPVRPVATVFARSLAAFMVKDGSPIKTPADFPGHSVGMYYGYDTETIYVELLNRLGVDRKRIKETAVQYDLARFYNGDVEVWPAYAINQPITAQLAGHAVRTITPDQFGLKYYSDTLIIKDGFGRTDPATVRAFMRGSEKGWDYALSNRDEAVQMVLKREPRLDPKQQRLMLDVVAQYVRPGSPKLTMELDVWQSIQDALVRQGALKEAVDLKKFLEFGVGEGR